MIKKIQALFFAKSQTFLYATGFFWMVMRELFLPSKRYLINHLQVTTMQVLFTGVNAFFITTLISLSLGSLIILLLHPFSGLGKDSFLYPIMIRVIARELGPLLTAFVIMARSGVAITIELSNMVISREIEAYTVTGVNPLAYLVVPRIMGVTLSVLALNLYAILSGVGGSYLLVNLLYPIPANEYFFILFNKFSLTDISSNLVKSIAFGFVIGFVSSYIGLKTIHSITEIPRLVIRSVGSGFGILIVVNILITLIYTPL